MSTEDGEFVLAGSTASKAGSRSLQAKLLAEERALSGIGGATFSWWPPRGWSPCCCCYRGVDESMRSKPKVPEITLLFWTIKLLTTGLGEVCSDAMSAYSPVLCVGVGLVGLAVALVLQFRREEYYAPVYWSVVLMIAVFGTGVADVFGQMTTLDSPYFVTTPMFAVVCAGMFYAWYRSEGTLDIHSIVTRRRESFYWGCVFCTFSLGTAAGDLTAFQPLKYGFRASIYIYAVLISPPLLVHTLKLFRSGGPAESAVFWIAYVLTRPLGASVSDYLSKDATEACVSPFDPNPPDVFPSCRQGNSLGWGDWQVSVVGMAVFLVLVAAQTYLRNDIQKEEQLLQS